jgi:hypothetical protein
MIVYELRCEAGHGFEAWFNNSEAFDQQRDSGQIACPVCGDINVGKAPMAPRIGRGDRPDPAKVRAMMTKIAELNRHIAEKCDYVGAAFPEEARKIHYGEVAQRDIYGEASTEEADQLREEGIEVAAVPWIRRDDA